MTKCGICGKIAELGTITGTLEETGKPVTMCWGCFFAKYELVKPAKTNIFRKKKTKKNKEEETSK